MKLLRHLQANSLLFGSGGATLKFQTFYQATFTFFNPYCAVYLKADYMLCV